MITADCIAKDNLDLFHILFLYLHSARIIGKLLFTIINFVGIEFRILGMLSKGSTKRNIFQSFFLIVGSNFVFTM